MPFAQTGYYNRDPADARTYSVRTDGDRPLALNFTVREFAQRGEDRVVVHPSLVVALQALRSRFGRLDILSGYRTPGHNASVGGDDNSFHLRGMAADVQFPASGDASGIASYARDVLGMCVGMHASGTMHLSVGVEGGADRTIVEPGVYVQFRNLYPGGQDRTTSFAEALVIGRAPFAGSGHLDIAQAGGGFVGLLALGLALSVAYRGSSIQY